MQQQAYEENNILITTHQNAIRCLLTKLGLYHQAFFALDDDQDVKVANGSIIKLVFWKQGEGWRGEGQFVFPGLMPGKKHAKFPSQFVLPVSVESDEELRTLFSEPGVGNGDAINTQWNAMTVWLIRHGKGVHNSSKPTRVLRGVTSLVSDVITDARLDSEGKMQAQAAGIWLNFCPLIRPGTVRFMGASDMMRAQQTMNLVRLRIHPDKFDHSGTNMAYTRIKIIPCNFEISGSQGCDATGLEGANTENKPKEFYAYAASINDMESYGGAGRSNCDARHRNTMKNIADLVWSGVEPTRPGGSMSGFPNPIANIAPIMEGLYHKMMNPYTLADYVFYETTVRTYISIAGKLGCAGVGSSAFPCSLQDMQEIKPGTVATLNRISPGTGLSQAGSRHIPVVVVSSDEPPPEVVQGYSTWADQYQRPFFDESSESSFGSDFYGGSNGTERWRVALPGGEIESVSANVLTVAPPSWMDLPQFDALFQQTDSAVFPPAMMFAGIAFSNMKVKSLPSVGYASQFSSMAQGAPQLDWRDYISFYRDYALTVPCRDRLPGAARTGLAKYGCANPCNGLTMLLFISQILERTLRPNTRPIKLFGRTEPARISDEEHRQNLLDAAAAAREEALAQESTERDEVRITGTQPDWEQLSRNRVDATERARAMPRSMKADELLRMWDEQEAARNPDSQDEESDLDEFPTRSVTPEDEVARTRSVSQSSSDGIREEPITPPSEAYQGEDVPPPPRSNSMRARAGRFFGSVGRSIGNVFRRVTGRRGGRGARKHRGTRRAQRHVVRRKKRGTRRKAPKKATRKVARARRHSTRRPTTRRHPTRRHTTRRPTTRRHTTRRHTTRRHTRRHTTRRHTRRRHLHASSKTRRKK
jgi:broad specificity phosphatase PhoE